MTVHYKNGCSWASGDLHMTDTDQTTDWSKVTCGHCLKKKPRELDEKEKARGRSPGYWEMDPRDQWAEDKRLGILDWDGN